jgi:hypothetical protein
MNYIEEHSTQQSANGMSAASASSASAPFWQNVLVATALGIALLPPVNHGPTVLSQVVAPPFYYVHQSGTLEMPIAPAEPTDWEIIQQLNRIYNYLSAPQEIDQDSHRILYSNLWSLYE